LREEENKRKKDNDARLAAEKAADDERKKRLDADRRLKDMEGMMKDWNAKQKKQNDETDREEELARQIEAASNQAWRKSLFHLMRYNLSKAFNTMRDEAAVLKRRMRLISREIMKRRMNGLHQSFVWLAEYTEEMKLKEMQFQAYMLAEKSPRSPKSRNTPS